MDTKIYTFVLATRLRRRVFTAKNIPTLCSNLLVDFCKTNGCELIQHGYYDYGLWFSLSLPSWKLVPAIADDFRRYSSGPIRDAFKELWAMPSLWTRRCLIFEGLPSKDSEEMIKEFMDSIPKR